MTSEKESTVITTHHSVRGGGCCVQKLQTKSAKKIGFELVSWWEIRGELFFLFFLFQTSQVGKKIDIFKISTPYYSAAQ